MALALCVMLFNSNKASMSKSTKSCVFAISFPVVCVYVGVWNDF